jgi:tetratricopeptide (TPR) repeat protein
MFAPRYFSLSGRGLATHAVNPAARAKTGSLVPVYRTSYSADPMRFASRRASLLAALLATVIVGADFHARALATDNRDQALSHFQQGRKLYQVAEYRAAMAEFKAAFLLREDPVFLYNIALCHRQLGEARDAVVFYRRYLAADPNAENRAQVEKQIHDLELQPAASLPASTTVSTAKHDVTPPASLSRARQVPGTVPGFVSTSPAPEPATPSRARWWLWGAAVAVAGIVTTAVVLTRERANPNCLGISPCGTVR